MLETPLTRHSRRHRQADGICAGIYKNSGRRRQVEDLLGTGVRKDDLYVDRGAKSSERAHPIRYLYGQTVAFFMHPRADVHNGSWSESRESEPKHSSTTGNVVHHFLGLPTCAALEAAADLRGL